MMLALPGEHDLPLLRLRERQPQECRLTPDEVAYLLARHRAHLRLMPTPQPQVWQITALGVMGALTTPQRRIVIEPKIPLPTLLAPFAVLPGRGVSEVQAPLSGLDVLACQLGELMVERATVGLHRGYREFERCGPYLTGRLDLAKQVRQSPGQRGQFHTRGDDFTLDGPCNQVPLALARQLLASSLFHPRAVEALTRGLASFAPVEAVSLTEAVLEAFRREPIPPGYEALTNLCLWLASAPGMAAPTPGALLLSLERWFERLVAQVVSAACPGQVVWQPSFTPGEPGLLVRPDLAVVRAGRVRLVIDAKWKRRIPARQDLYQGIAYATLLGAPEVLLVLPGRGARQRYQFPQMRLEVCWLEVAGAAGLVQRSMQRLARLVRARSCVDDPGDAPA
ncbi:MAG: hypothetical protein U0840_16885 [Gemmataceae bacterium]